jgi:signal peptidase
MPRLNDALKNEYVKSLILLAVILVVIVVSWFGLKSYLRTDYPLLAVASGSMVPTLKVGDLIIVQGGFTVSDINATHETGDIIVFHKPYNPDELIVHRAVEESGEGLTTKGDNNPTVDPWTVNDGDLVGKVVWIVPYVGHVPLFVHTPTGLSVIVILIVILILLEFVIPLAKEKEEFKQPQDEATDSGIGSL